MKKVFLLILSLVLVLSGCSYSHTGNDSAHTKTQRGDYVKSVWVAYYELQKFIKDDESDFKNEIEKRFSQLNDMGFNTITVQVRPCADAFYKSSYFPSSKYCFGKQGVDMPYDPLKIMCAVAEKQDLSLEAWINPYRVSQDNDINKLSDTNFAKKWYKNKSKKRNVYVSKKAAYFNPASSDVNKLIVNGVKEIVLVGINLSSYGKGRDFNIVDAVGVCCENNKIIRVRLGSLEPDHITDEIIDGLAKYDKFCPQFHISLQSGCDKTLKSMNRHYDSAEYRELCEKLRKRFDDATITTDVMVGFNDETEDDFYDSLEFVKSVGFEKVHTFPYSERQGTAASKRGDNVPKAEKERRAKIMIEETQKVRIDYFESLINQTLDVLIENKVGNDEYQGYTKNYVPVKIKSDKNLIGEIKPVIVTGYDEAIDECIGKIRE
mgnify:FL=1